MTLNLDQLSDHEQRELQLRCRREDAHLLERGPHGCVCHAWNATVELMCPNVRARCEDLLDAARARLTAAVHKPEDTG